MIFFCSTRYLIVKDHFVFILKERSRRQEERQANCFARPRQHLFAFFSMRFDVALPGGRRGKLFISLGLVNTFLQLFQLRFSASTCSEAGEASYVFSCASSTPFCNFFSLPSCGANRPIYLRKNKPPWQTLSGFPVRREGVLWQPPLPVKRFF